MPELNGEESSVSLEYLQAIEKHHEKCLRHKSNVTIVENGDGINTVNLAKAISDQPCKLFYSNRYT